MKYYLRLIQAAIVAGSNINVFCAKHHARKGALRSMFFKLWKRAKLLANTVTVKQSAISNCWVIVNNTCYNAASMLSGVVYKGHIETFRSVYGFNLVIEVLLW